MRVTGTMFSESLVGQLSRLTTRQNQLQTQAATGQRISLPEDDPGAVRRTLDLQAESRTIAQQRKNIAALKEQATVSYGAMAALKRISDRAGEIAVLADGTRSPADLNERMGKPIFFTDSMIGSGVLTASRMRRWIVRSQR